MTILSREGPIAPPPEDDDASARRASQPEPAAEPALEPAPYRPGKPEEHGHDGGEDQHLGGTHAAPLIALPPSGTNRAAGAHTHGRNVLAGPTLGGRRRADRDGYYDDEVVEAALGVPPALRAARRAHIEALNVLAPDLACVRWQGKPYGFAAPPWRAALHRLGTRVVEAARWRLNRAGLNVLLARPNRRTFADYNDELRCGSRALLDRVLLTPRTLERGWWRLDVVRRLVERHLAARANLAPALGVILTLELFARVFLDPQEQERFGLDELDQVQLRAADGWLVCTENTAPAPVAVHETPADTLMPGIPEQGPE